MLTLRSDLRSLYEQDPRSEEDEMFNKGVRLDVELLMRY